MHSIRGWADWQPSISTIDSHLHQRHVSWSGEFNLWWFVSHNAGDITISRWLESRMLLKTESDVEGFFPLPSISFPSLSLALSHKSHLPNSCLRSEIILRLFFTVAAQRWICKRFFFFLCVRAPVCVRCACLVISRQCRSAAWFEGKCLEKRWLVETGFWIFYRGGLGCGGGGLCLHRLLLLDLQTTGGFPICLSENTFTFPPREGHCGMKLALTGFEYHFTKVNSHFCCRRAA